MNKLIFIFLLTLMGLGLLFSSLKFALFFALLKVLLVLFFYMELLKAHAAWKLAAMALILATFGGLSFY